MTFINEESLPLDSFVSETVAAPGLHIIANLKSEQTLLLEKSNSFQVYIEQLIYTHQLNRLGQVYYDFPTGGYTAVVCLSESHLSIHTWPETGYITFDIFLSNYKHNNQGITQAIYQSVCSFFQASVIEEHFINR